MSHPSVDFSEKLQMLVCVWPHEHFVRATILPPAWSAFDGPQRPFIAWMGRREETDHAGKSRSRTEWPQFETGSVLGFSTMAARRNGSRRAARTPRSLDEFRKLTINALVLLAVGLIAIIVYQAYDERLAIIEPITILKSLETENGYTSAIVARRLIDQVEHINATARTRVERVKVGQESQFSSLSTLQVPASGLTLQTFVSLLRTAFGPEDERIGGEITIKPSDEVPTQTVYQIRLRFDIKQEASDRPVRPCREPEVRESPGIAQAEHPH